jgi:hypothetical protein
MRYMITDDKPFREPSASEREIFDRLLEPEFEGRDALREQLGGCFVRTIDEGGSLKISVHSNIRVRTRWRVSVEGEDADAMVVHVLLHVIEGEANELEVYKDDNFRLVSSVTPSRLELFCPPLVR